MQSCRLSPLCLALISLAVMASAAPTEMPDDDDNTLLDDPPVTDLTPDLTTEDQPAWPGFGGWSSFLGKIPKRRSSLGDKPPGPSRSGRRGNSQQQGVSRRRGEKTPDLVSEEPDVEDPIQRVFARLEEAGIEGGRFGRGQGHGRRGGKKKEDADFGQVKPEGRRSGSRSEKNKARDDPEEEEEEETELTTVEETAEPCEDLLETRAGPASDTVAALLDNIDNPEVLRPILEDLEANVNGVQEE